MMQPAGANCRLSNLSIIFVTLLLSIATGFSAQASGKGHHHPEQKMSEHMQAMQAVKEKIPEEYRLMERTPILPDEDSLQQGHKLFLAQCSVCHGEKGDGKGPAAAALKPPPANFLDRKHSAIYGPGEKFWIIGHGTEATGMPSFPDIAPVDRWHLVNYIFQLQEQTLAKQQEHGHH